MAPRNRRRREERRMELKKRLVISFCCIVLIPIVLFLALGATIIHIQLVSMKMEYGIRVSPMDLIQNSTRMFDQLMDKLQEELDEKWEEDPSFFIDSAALAEYCDEITPENVEFAIFRGKDVVYQTEDLGRLLNEQLYRELTYGQNDMVVRFLDDKCFCVYRIFFEDPENAESIAIYAAVFINQWLPQVRVVLVQGAFAILFILLLTASLCSIWIYRSIVKPIDVLKEAAKKIKDGELNFHIRGGGRDELGQLCAGFEEMRQRLKESAEEKIQYDSDSKELISNISHDLKTPITAIKGYVEGILDGVADTPEKMNKYARTIYNKAIEMDRLIDELTFYSKIDTNRIPYNFLCIDVNEYFNDCAAELSTDLEAQNIRFQYVNYVPENVKMSADPEQFRKVINNIVSNSIKYYDKEMKFFNMRIRQEGGSIKLSFEDNGKGIPEKDLPHIFDRFYRTDSSRNTSGGGSGIGLSIVRKIVEDHNGKVSAASRDGYGTCISITIPEYKARQPD